jgi:hypothetical protein
MLAFILCVIVLHHICLFQVLIFVKFKNYLAIPHRLRNKNASGNYPDLVSSRRNIPFQDWLPEIRFQYEILVSNPS